MTTQTMSPEEILKEYDTALLTVRIINDILDSGDQPWGDSRDTMVSSNLEYLKILVDMDFWTTEDLSPILDCINANV